MPTDDTPHPLTTRTLLLPFLRHRATCHLQADRDNAPWDDLCDCGLRDRWLALESPAPTDDTRPDPLREALERDLDTVGETALDRRDEAEALIALGWTRRLAASGAVTEGLDVERLLRRVEAPLARRDAIKVIGRHEAGTRERNVALACVSLIDALVDSQRGEATGHTYLARLSGVTDRPQDEALERLAFAAEAYREAVTSYLDPTNQFTYSRQRHMERCADELDALTSAALSSQEPVT